MNDCVPRCLPQIIDDVTEWWLSGTSKFSIFAVLVRISFRTTDVRGVAQPG